MSSETHRSLSILGHAILGLLEPNPMSGYELMKEFDRTLANVWSAKHSQIYPELARLLELGYIELYGSTGPRGRKDYASTAAGKAELRTWLTTTEPQSQPTNEAVLRSFFVWTLAPATARGYYERREADFRGEILRYEAIAATLSTTEDPHAVAARIALEAGIRLNQAAAEWAAWAAQKYARAESEK